MSLSAWDSVGATISLVSVHFTEGVDGLAQHCSKSSASAMGLFE